MNRRNPHRQNQNVKRNRSLDQRKLLWFRLRNVFVFLWIRECKIGFPKTFLHSKIVREGETLPHEGKVAVFVFSYPRNSKNVFPKVGLCPIRISTLFQSPHSLNLSKNQSPISFSCVDIACCGF